MARLSWDKPEILQTLKKLHKDGKDLSYTQLAKKMQPLVSAAAYHFGSYRTAVEKAGSTDSAKVLEALPTVSFDGPRGTIRMDKQHHAPLTMYLGQVQGDGSVKVASTFKDVDPGAQCPNLK